MKRRFRTLIVVTRKPKRGLRFAGSEDWGLPVLDVAENAARLLAAGAEVRVTDPELEDLSDRAVRRLAQKWAADLVLLHAGGTAVAANPVPDDRPLAALLAGWRGTGPVVACGPLADLYGAELLDRHPRLAGALAGPAGAALVGDWNPPAVPGLLARESKGVPAAPLPAALPAPLPAWQTLDLEACTRAAVDGLLALPVLMGEASAPAVLAAATHALRRGSARRIVFLDRCFARDAARAIAVAEGMLSAAPAVGYRCRLEPARLDQRLAVVLHNTGCRHVLLSTARSAQAPGSAPMDDPERPALEAAVQSARVVGLPVTVEFIVGRPGHSRVMLTAWQRWFADRGIEVRARVRVAHAGSEGPGLPGLREAAATAGVRDTMLTARDVTRLVRELTAPERAAAGLYGG